MKLTEQLFEAAKPFLFREGLESSKEIIATNSVPFSDMGMANTKPGEFAPEEITDPENLVNTAKMSNDNDFGDDEDADFLTAIFSVSTTPNNCEHEIHELADLIDLGKEDAEKHIHHHEHHDHEESPIFTNIIESILRRKDSLLLEGLNEAELDEMAFQFRPELKLQASKGKAARDFVSFLSAKRGAIESGELHLPSDMKEKWETEILPEFKKYSISNLGSVPYNKILEKLITNRVNEYLKSKGIDPASAEGQQFYTGLYNNEFNNPDVKTCEEFMEILLNKISDYLSPEDRASLHFEPNHPLTTSSSKNDKTNYEVVRKIQEAFAKKIVDNMEIVQWFTNYLNGNSNTTDVPATEEPEVVPAKKGKKAKKSKFSDEDLALLQKHNFDPESENAQRFLDMIKEFNVKESVLTESDYAGNLSYNPDKRLNASDILNAVKNAVKPELAAGLSVNKDVDANEEPSYVILNIDEKELPEKLEIDTNTDKKVVLKKDGNSYKFDK